tara:strand:+ start:626 stop:1981 length:1356 start_codon:yes stop_codon:yes gene_type:complete
MKLPDKREYNIAIIGLGYVGLPLAVKFSLNNICYKTKNLIKRKVIGFDINEIRINELRNGFDRTKEITKNTLLNCKNLFFTSKEEYLIDADVFIVTVPTPINEDKTPDLRAIKNASKIFANAIKKRFLDKNRSIPIVVYESTVFPGLTEEICVPIIEKESGYKYATKDNLKKFVYGYSPERINPGDKNKTLMDIVKVTSGSDPDTADWIDSMYASIIEKGTYKAKSVKIAEAAKVIENTQRDLNIALVNELSIIFKKLDIDTLDVLDAASTKWNFQRFTPGLVGGHCIGVDPYYLTYKSQISGYTPEIVLSGRRINDNMAKWIAEQVILELTKRKKNVINSKVLIMGYTFKENCPDTRNTKIIDLYNSLLEFGLTIKIVDPWVINSNEQKIENICFIENLNNNRFDAVILAVAHYQFMKLETDDWNNLLNKDGIFFDLKGIIPRSLNPLRI